jgi:mycothiol S-conjugate amidase
MFVHAHPDDESSKGAATMAELVAAGHEVMVVTCTGGEQGSLLNPDLEHLDPAEIATLRRNEMDDALSHLGVQHRWLGYLDSGMPADGIAAPDTFAAQADSAAEDLAELIREFRPDVLVTYNETGGYPHLDHIATHRVSIAAVEAAADAERSASGEPHSVSKVYYHVPFDPETVEAVHKHLLANGRESPFDRPPLHLPRRVTTKVRARRRSAIAAERALSSHRTQINGHNPWLSLPRRMRRVEKFERAQPEPGHGERLEFSLLTGLPDSVKASPVRWTTAPRFPLIARETIRRRQDRARP